jgi:signal transduction histidine kinase
MVKRIIADIVLFFSLFFLAWYWTAILAVIFIILFRWFWEGVVAAVFLDALYSIPEAKIYAHFGIFTASSLVLMLIMENIKTKIRFI